MYVKSISYAIYCLIGKIVIDKEECHLLTVLCQMPILNQCERM